MKIIALLLLAQTTAAPADQQGGNDAELRGAYTCLVSQTDEWLEEFDWEPEMKERWGWARKIMKKCDHQIIEAAKSQKVSESSSASKHGEVHSNISATDRLRIEATYFVDGLIEQHFETAK